VVVDANRPQCSVDADCVKRGTAFAGSVCLDGLCGADPKEVAFEKQWSCRGPAENQNPGYQVTMHLRDAITTKPLPGVQGQLCAKRDVDCKDPLRQGTADTNGTLVLAVDAGFDGYVQLTDSHIAPALYFLTPPASGDLDLPTVPLATPLVASGIAQSSGGTAWNQERGIVLLNAFDCQGAPAVGVSFSLGGVPDPSAFNFYLVDGLPTNKSTVTDYTGYGGLVNVAAGATTIAATLQPSNRKVGNISILIRAGYISYSNVTPSSL